jgi:ClpP class serine protease
MLSTTSRQEILRKLKLKVGFAIWEGNLTPATRQAIANLAMVQRHLFVVTEVLRGERSRVERSAVLTLASRLGYDPEKDEKAGLVDEIGKLQSEVNAKITELSQQVLKEEEARKAGLPPPEYEGKLEVAQLKCPQCGASLPMPTSSMIQCQYCNSILTIRDVSSQISSMIQSI